MEELRTLNGIHEWFRTQGSVCRRPGPSKNRGQKFSSSATRVRSANRSFVLGTETSQVSEAVGRRANTGPFSSVATGGFGRQTAFYRHEETASGLPSTLDLFGGAHSMMAGSSEDFIQRTVDFLNGKVARPTDPSSREEALDVRIQNEDNFQALDQESVAHTPVGEERATYAVTRRHSFPQSEDLSTAV